jgi:hypothetical protein
MTTLVVPDRLEELAVRLEADASELERLQATAIAAMEAYRDKLRPSVALLRRIARHDHDYADMWSSAADQGGAWLRGAGLDIFDFGVRGYGKHLRFVAGLFLERARTDKIDKIEKVA